MSDERRESDPPPGPPSPGPSGYDATIRAGAGSPPPSSAVAPSQEKAEAAPQRLGGYRLLKKLGSGGMGAIYLGVQESVGRQVALKVLPESAFHDADAVARFQREIQVLGQMRHPGICPVMDSGLDGKTHYYVMEYIRGMDVARVLRLQRVEPRRAADIAAQVARALQSAHDAGVIHRDLKPLNIMLTRGEKPREAAGGRSESTPFGGALKRFFSWASMSGSRAAAAPSASLPGLAAESAAEAGMPAPEWRDRAVLIDFGLARDGAAATHLTVSGAMMGTPAYMAPEQARGDRRAIGPATDVYGLGATLYEMLTLRPPFGGETMGEVISRVVNEEPAPVRSLNPLVDRDLETIVQKAMEKEPARRYASAAAMAQDLEHWLAGEPILARRASVAYRVRKRLLRNKAASAAIAAAVLLAAAGIWQTFSPGEIVVSGRDLEGATLFVDGVASPGRSARVWPGRHVVKVTRPEFVDFSEDVEVSARKQTALEVALISRFGYVTVKSEPPGAEVRDRDVLLGVTPLVRCRVPTGERFIEVRLRDYEASSFPVTVRPGDLSPEITRQLRHETGLLTLTSDPPELGIDLYPEGVSRPIIAAAPAEKFALPTGRYRVLAHARNHFPHEFALEVRAGEEVKRNVTLTALMRWRTTADMVSEGVAAGDLNGDGRPDLVVASKTPARIRALDGRNGELIWIARKPPLTASYGLPLNLSDLDGDLEPEVVYSAGDRLVALDGRTGVEKRAWEVPGLRDAVDWGDLDGDGVPDFVAHTGGLVLALSGADAHVLWSVPSSPNPAYYRGDMDGDGRPDVGMATGDAGLQAIDGKTGQAIWRVPGWNRGGATCCIDVDGDGRDDLLTVDRDNAPTAIRGSDGTILWSAPKDDYIMVFPPVAADLEGDGTLEAIFCRGPLLEVRNALTGKLIVSHDLGPGCSPAIYDVDADGHKDLIMAGAGTLLAMDALTGRRLWQFDSNTSASMGTPLLDDFDGDGLQDFILLSHDGTVACVNAVEPPVLWRQGNVHMHSAEPDVLGTPPRFVFLAGYPQRLLDPADGRILAELPYANCKVSAVYSAEPPFRLALDGLDRILVDVTENPPGLKLAWRQKDAAVLSAPTLADLNGDGRLDFLTGDGEGGPGVRASDGRTGELLWNAPLGRPWRADIAVWEKLVWVPAANGLHGLDPATGKEMRVLDLGGIAQGGLAFDGDLIGWNAGGRVIRFTSTARGPEERWRRDLGVGLATRGVAALGPHVVAQCGRGTVVALEAKSGEERWRQVVEQSNAGGPGLRDVDGDGVPEVAVSSYDAGWVWVLEGKTGRVAWAWRTGTQNGWSRPAWADLDNDGAPELLCSFRDGRAYAFTVRLGRPEPVSVLAPDGNPFHATAQSALALRRRAAVMARRNSRWSEVINLAEGTADPYLATEAARAAARQGDAPAARRFALVARKVHVRRLDVDIAACLDLPASERASALKHALLSASPAQVAAALPPPGIEAEWAEALAAAAPAAEAAGDWELAVALHGIRPDYAAALAAFQQASRDRAPGSRLRLALGRAAAAADQFTEAREQFRAVLADPVLAATAQFEIDALQRLGEQLKSDMRTAFATGRYEAGMAAGERLVRLRPTDPEAWNELAWDVATSAAPPPAVAQRATEAARRAVQLLDEQGVGPGDQRAGILDTLAAALFAAGDVAGAVRVQKEALGMASGEGVRADLQTRLDTYERALHGQ